MLFKYLFNINLVVVGKTDFVLMKTVISKNIYEGPMDMDNGVGIEYESGGRLYRGGKRGKWDNCNSIINKILRKENSHLLIYSHWWNLF